MRKVQRLFRGPGALCGLARRTPSRRLRLAGHVTIMRELSTAAISKNLKCESGVEIGHVESTIYMRLCGAQIKTPFVSPLFTMRAIFNS